MADAEITIRFATPDDALLLAEIGHKSFYDAFGTNPLFQPKDVELHLSRSFGEAIQARELQDAQIVYLIAEVDGVAAGFAKLHRDSFEECVTGKKPLEISRFYFLQEWLGKGASGKLMRAVLDYARDEGFDTVWLGVWRFNYRAHKFYQKWGFEKAGEHVFMFGEDAQNDWVMQRKV